MNRHLHPCSILLVVLCFSFSITSLSGQHLQKLNLQVSNVCEYYGQTIYNNPTDSFLVSPTFGSAGCIYSSAYTHYDSLSVLNKIKHVAVDESASFNNSPKQMYFSDDQKILQFYSYFPGNICDPTIFPGDTLTTDSIADMKVVTNKLLVIRNTDQPGNFIVYDTLNFDTLSILHLNMVPKLFDADYAFASVVGIDSANDVVLNVIELNTGLIVENAVFGQLASTPIAIKYAQTKVFLISQPGDSAIYLSTYNFNNNSISTSNIYSSSGAHTFAWEGNNFHFQPEADLNGTNYDTQVLTYDLLIPQPLIVSTINKRLHKLCYAGGEGYYPYMHGVEESNLNNKVYVYSIPGYYVADSIISVSQVDFVESDFRCFVGLNEYDDNLVKILVYPNPADQMITIKASGLICGRDYKMDIVDLNGKIMLEKTIHAKMSLEIPLSTLAPGVYLFRIHTRKGFVSERVVKQ